MVELVSKTIPNLRLKYILGAFFGCSLFFLSVFLAGLIAIDAKALFPNDPDANMKAIFLSIGAVIAVACLFKFGALDSFRTARLSLRPEFSALILNEEGVRIGAGLFTSLERPRMISRGEPSVFWKWEQIHEFLVEPGRGAGKLHTRPNFRIKTSPTGCPFFVWRKPFLEIETRIIDFARSKLGDRLQLNDKVAG